MRLLFCLRHAGYLRSFRSTLELLGERGNEIVLVLGKHWRKDDLIDGLRNRLETGIPGLTVRPGLETHRRVERDLPWALRHWLAYLWFLEPGLRTASKPRERVRAGIPPPVLEATEAVADNHEFRRSLAAVVGTLESMLPVPEPFTRLVAGEDPDAVVVSPLLERGIPQVNYLRAARQLGIPTGLCVASWDNLTNKGPIQDPIDLVAVWNAGQKREAVELHGVPPENVAVTGAPVYDEWFGREPSSSRSEFCERVGLPDDRPYLLYVCSSGFIAADEAGWIVRWLERLRGSGLPELADVPVLVRPHPQKRVLDGSPEAQRLEAIPGVAIHPPEGQIVIGEQALTAYYDALHHSAAVVGINTSAMIEAAFAGRGVYVLLGERYRDSQEGILHFHHLQRAGGGLIQATADPDEHAAALARALRGEDAAEAADRARAFLSDFIRPQGLDQSSTPLLADALERLAATPRREVPEAAGLPQEVLDRLAAELEPLFHIRRGRTIASKPPPKTRGRRARAG